MGVSDTTLHVPVYLILCEYLKENIKANKGNRELEYQILKPISANKDKL